ncbi:gamma-glutamylcyclotransferase family protein [Agrobacterium fabrum]|uniref:gamma-glutamylcyclotransferase family protein n=1 Tax=Agrobacterium fabrum TaxID=1176649 RepID=UPI00298EFD45|nr:gamma-glutamylcyclotransferase family protein [Agrobacterium fabrum]
MTQAQNLSDYQAVGVRCRGGLLELIGVAQDAATWTDTPPQRANFRAWAEIICNDLLPGDTNKERRGALKSALKSAWTFSNWLTHSKSATWIDADMAHSLIQHAIGMATSLIIRELRGVPLECPKCGSPHLEPEHGENIEAPDVLWERPRCADCGWTGRPVPILDLADGHPIITREGEETDECSIMTVALRTILKSGNATIEPLMKTETGVPEHVVYFAYGPTCRPPGCANACRAASHSASLPCRVIRSVFINAAPINPESATHSPVKVIGRDRGPVQLRSYERAKLDKAEGVGNGYEHATVTVISDKGRRRKVLTYLAAPDYIDDSLKPYGRYKDFVLAGGREHGLPSEYISEYIESVEPIEDPDKIRDNKRRATFGSPGTGKSPSASE